MPKTPDEFAAALFVLLILGALLLVGLGRLVVWLAGLPKTVKRSRKQSIDYVAQSDQGGETKTPFPQEREPEREPEPLEPAPLPRPEVNGKLYTDKQLEKLKRDERDHGAAEAVGLFLAWGLLPLERETEAMEALYGPRGRRHQAARPIIAAAVEASAPARVTPLAERPVAAGASFVGEA